MQYKNKFASRIKSSFNYHEVVSMHILHSDVISSSLKEKKCWDFKCSSENASFRWLFSEQWRDDKSQSQWDHLHITERHRRLHTLSEVIKSRKKFLKSKLHRDHDEIKKTMNSVKNIKYIRDMKWVSEVQWSQKWCHQKDKILSLLITDAWIKWHIKISLMLCKVSQNWKSII